MAPAKALGSLLMKRVRRIATNPVVFAALFFLGCDAAARDSEAYDSVETITAGCGGGIAGIVEFAYVHRDGQVEYRMFSSFARRPGPDSVSVSRVDGWLESLESARFFQQESPKSEPYPDQMGCLIQLAGPHRTHEFAVYLDPLGDPEILRVFKEVYGLIQPAR
jgi:hypothetical protein